jgi:hypothetical protein
MTLNFMGYGGIIIDAVPGVENILVGAKNRFHLPFQDENEFFSLVGRELFALHRGGFQGNQERFHMPIFFIKPQALVRVPVTYAFLGGKTGSKLAFVFTDDGKWFSGVVSEKSTYLDLQSLGNFNQGTERGRYHMVLDLGKEGRRITRAVGYFLKG